MGMLGLLAGAIIWCAVGLSAADAQPVLPDHRYATAPDTDFYGADLGQFFDTTRAACALACDAQSYCVAFTFNTRSNACFLKSEVTQVEFFTGAFSARELLTPAAAHTLAAQRQTALGALTEDDIAAAHARGYAQSHWCRRGQMISPLCAFRIRHWWSRRPSVPCALKA